MGLAVPHQLYAGDLDGIGTLIGVALFLLLNLLVCWVLALIEAVKKLRQKPYRKTRLIVISYGLCLFSIFIYNLYTGKPEVQILGASFFLIPVILSLIGVIVRRKTNPND